MDKLYIVIPAYNEAENIEKVVSQWYPVVEKVGEDSRLLIINDGSTDKTWDKIKDAASKYHQIIGINKKNEGHGATILSGYMDAIRFGADYIFQTDSDGQTNPDEFWQFWDKREKCGLLIGYRKGRQDGLSRVFVTRTLRLVLFLIFKVWIKDANTPFRLMKADQLDSVLEDIPAKFNLSNVIMTVLYEKKYLGVEYIPITFKPRQGGVNSIDMKKIFKIGKQSLKDFKQINKSINQKIKKEEKK